MMNKKLVLLLIIFTLFFIVLNVQKKNKVEAWSPIPIGDIQFKVGEIKETTRDGIANTITTTVLGYEVYAVIPKKILWFSRKESISNFSVRMLDDKSKYISAFLSINYDYERGIISGYAHSVNTEGYFYIGEGKVVEGILKPTFLKGATFYFNPKAECGEFTCPGIQIVLPYTFEELKRISKQEIVK